MPNAVSSDLERFQGAPLKQYGLRNGMYIEGESLKPNAVSRDLARFDKCVEIAFFSLASLTIWLLRW